MSSPHLALPILLACLFSSVSAQTRATTEDGLDILVYDDGTWAYATEPAEPMTTTVFIGGERARAAAAADLFNYEHRNPLAGSAREVWVQAQLFERDGGVWIAFMEVDGDYSTSPLRMPRLSQDDVFIYLGVEDDAIRLVERGQRGQSRTEGGGLTRYALYRLTDDEVDRLKSGRVSAVSFPMDSGRTLFPVSFGARVLAEQARALGY